MKRNRFSVTRLVLVLVLIGGLYKVGTIVNPPPVGPPEPIKAPQASAQVAQARQAGAAQQATEMKDRIKKQMTMAKIDAEKQQLERKYNHQQLLPKTDGITPEYFQHVSMGAAGIKQTEQEQAHIKEVTDKVNSEVAAKQAAAGSSTPAPASMKPPATPTSATPK